MTPPEAEGAPHSEICKGWYGNPPKMDLALCSCASDNQKGPREIPICPDATARVVAGNPTPAAEGAARLQAIRNKDLREWGLASAEEVQADVADLLAEVDRLARQVDDCMMGLAAADAARTRLVEQLRAVDDAVIDGDVAFAREQLAYLLADLVGAERPETP